MRQKSSASALLRANKAKRRIATTVSFEIAAESVLTWIFHTRSSRRRKEADEIALRLNPPPYVGYKMLGFREHYESYGRGKPLIILHGLFGSLENWHPISQKLSIDFNVLAVDQRNHGRSPHATEMNYEIMAQDLKEFVMDRHLATVHVLGHSLGGKTAMVFALNYPELLEKLIVVDMAPRAYPPHHRQILDALSSLDLSGCKNRKDIEAQLANSIPELALRQFLLKNVKRDTVGAFYWQMNLKGINANYDRLSEALASPRTFNKPMLFIRGEHSDYIRNEDLQLIRILFPQAAHAEIPAAGHWVHVDAPEAFLRTVRDFLQR